ncbi:3-oxoacyl-[acyl-carrier-protein] synthase III C-terminal domain-containing protein [Pseudomonas sp. NPDC007930]|uniref:3-oxoacyl-ACP synthase III family protein n=1 Tax=Pseudomonas sp. NPDC007930 TaxID=3364417 RepID=UPI0036EA25B4
MITTLPGLGIRAITAALPPGQLTAEDFARLFGEREAARIRKSTGINSVRIAEQLSTVDLAYGAAAHLLGTLDLDPHSLDALVLVTQTPAALMPASSALLAARLGLRHSTAVFDLNMGCSGYVYGLFQASLLIAAGYRRVLLCTGDVISKLLNPNDHQVRMLFGDAASATLVEAGPHRFSFTFNTDGQGAAHLHTPLRYGPASGASAEVGQLFMDGAQVMNFALDQVPPALKGFLAGLGLGAAQVPYFLLHQANAFMLHYLGRTLGLAPSRIPMHLDGIGNSGPSSIPVMLSAIPDNPRLCQNDLIACGFGVGLSVALAHLSLEGTQLLPPVILNPTA